MKCKLYNTSGELIGETELDGPQGAIQWNDGETSRFFVPHDQFTSGADIGYKEVEVYSLDSENIQLSEKVGAEAGRQTV